MFLLHITILCSAQTTKVRGRVTDENGEGIPFAGVFFKGTTTGITTDLDGYYSLICDDLSADILVAQLLGYDIVEKKISAGKFTTVNFTLHLTDNLLSGAKVKADNRKAAQLLANIQKHRDRNDPDRHKNFSCDIYSNIELDLTHPQEQLRSKTFLREFGFVFDYVDTSSVSGVPYLPVMMSETIARRTRSSSPDFDSEKVIANRVSGINPEGNNLLSQFTGSMHLKTNFYRPFIDAFDMQFPSPIQEAGLLYYNYYIIDTVMTDGRKNLLVRFHPKPLVSSPTFDGEMRIDVQDFALRSIHARMKNTTNVNWMRDFILDAEYVRCPDSTWFYKSDKLYADLSLTLRDSSKMMSFIGKRELNYSNVDFSPSRIPDRKAGIVDVSSDASLKDDAFWAEVRPRPLSPKEESVYEMVDRVKTVPLFNGLYDVIETLVNGYYDYGKIGIGPYFKLLSHNTHEGLRLHFGLRTSPEFSRRDRIGAYAAFGFRDTRLKGGATWEHMFSRVPERKLTVSAKRDVVQLGRSSSPLAEGNILATVFGGSKTCRLTEMSSYSVNYKHEFSMNLNAEAGFDFKRYYPSSLPWVGERFHVPLIAPDGNAVSSVAANEFYLSMRFSKDETVNRGHFVKKYVHSRYPAVTLSLAASLDGLRENDFGYFRPELSLRWNPRIPPFGTAKFYLNAGTITGQVPYPMLHIHEGNSTYLYDRFSFACMEFMEFASDTWITMFYDHCFNGFFLGKIPLIRNLGLREQFTARLAWGWLRSENNGDRTLPAESIIAPVLLPNGTSQIGSIPYVELGAGISNILKVLRIDFFWRMTHRNERLIVDEDSELAPAGVTAPGGGTRPPKVLRYLRTPNFAVKIGAEISF